MTAHEKRHHTKTPKTPVNKWSVYGIMLAIFTVAGFLFWMIGGLLAYPANTHREVAVSITELTNEAWQKTTPEEMDKAFENPELKRLESTAEARYSSVVNTVMFVIQVVGWVALVGLSYNYLRKKHIGKDQAMAVALIDAISTVLIYPLMIVLTSVFYPIGSMTIPGVDVGLMMLAGIPLVFCSSVLVTYIVARIFQWRYNRKYNFAVE